MHTRKIMPAGTHSALRTVLLLLLFFVKYELEYENGIGN